MMFESWAAFTAASAVLIIGRPTGLWVGAGAATVVFAGSRN